MPGEVQRIQLARILRLELATLTNDSARLEISARPGEMANAFFAEAAASDDVTGCESALDYLEARMADFAGLIPAGAAEAIRVAFRERLRAWSRTPGNPAGSD